MYSEEEEIETEVSSRFPEGEREKSVWVPEKERRREMETSVIVIDPPFVVKTDAVSWNAVEIVMEGTVVERREEEG